MPLELVPTAGGPDVLPNPMPPPDPQPPEPDLTPEPAPVPPLPEPVPAYGVVLAAQVKGRWLTPVSEVPSEDCSCTESTLGEDQGKAEGVAR